MFTLACDSSCWSMSPRSSPTWGQTPGRLRSLHRLGRRDRAKNLNSWFRQRNHAHEVTRPKMVPSFSRCRHRDANIIIIVGSDDRNQRSNAERGEARHTISSSADDRLKRARRSFLRRARHIVIRFSTGGLRTSI
jgi:hypothetical protein